MSGETILRAFTPADLPAVWQVFHDAAHGLTAGHYTPAQRDAWAPAAGPSPEWAARVTANAPRVAERAGQVAGFADLQHDGLIDMCFVHPAHARSGVASALMAQLLVQGQHLGLGCLHAQVSLSAEPFFTRWGFEIEARQIVTLRGQRFANARMVRHLDPRP